LKICRCAGNFSNLRLFGKAVLLVFLGFLFFCPSALALSVENSKNVLVLYSHKNPQPYTELINKAILSTLESNKTYRFEYYIEYMDTTRFPDGVYFKRLLDFYRQKYSSRKMDLLIAVSVPALDFLLKYRGELFSETPIIFCGVGKRRLSNLSLGPNVTGITWKTDIKRTIDVALNLHPGTRRVVVIGGASKTDQNWVAAARKVFRGYEDEIEFTYLTGRNNPSIRSSTICRFFRMALEPLLLHLRLCPSFARHRTAPFITILTSPSMLEQLAVTC